jgi:Condensation domain
MKMDGPLVRLASGRHLLVLTNHHILLEGWSMPVFFDELVALYGNGGDTDALPSVRPYADYLVWLAAQNHDAALGTWREYLVGLDGPTRLAPTRAQDGSPAIPQRWEADLPTELTARLQALARQRGLTLNTVVQGLWAVLLGRLTGRDDVVFGVTVAGRPAELAGVERMVGLFINTLPARILVNDDRPLADWLREIQAKQAEADQFAFSSLADVQCWSEVPGGTPLFDSILVFENYPVDRSLDGQPGGLKVSDGRAFEQTNYPLSLEIVPEVRTLVRLRYDTGRFGAATVRLLLDQILTLLEAFAADLGRTLGDLASPAPAGRPAPVVPHRETHGTRRGDAVPGRRTGGPATREESRLAASRVSRGVQGQLRDELPPSFRRSSRPHRPVPGGRVAPGRCAAHRRGRRSDARTDLWGWGRFAEGPVEVVDLPGDHLSSCSSPTSRCSRNDWNGSWIALPGQDGARR